MLFSARSDAFVGMREGSSDAEFHWTVFSVDCITSDPVCWFMRLRYRREGWQAQLSLVVYSSGEAQWSTLDFEAI